jgi:hypothetical protein
MQSPAATFFNRPGEWFGDSPRAAHRISG